MMLPERAGLADIERAATLRQRGGRLIAKRSSLRVPRPLHLSIELLETFASLASHDGDAAQAGTALRINQPSMSKRLKHLRDKGKVLTKPWIYRDGKTWKLTAEGLEILPAVQDILARYHQIQHFATGSAHHAPQPELRFACWQTAAVQLVPDALSEWRAARPTAKIRISTMRDVELVQGVASGALDMALVSYSKEEIEELSRVPMDLNPVAAYGFLAVCSPDAVRSPQSTWAHAFRRLPNVIPFKAVVPFPLITPEPDSNTRAAIDRLIARRKLRDQIRIVMETGGWPAILELVRHGHGVGIVSEAANKLIKDYGLLVRRIDTRDLPLQHLKLLTRKHTGGSKDTPLIEVAAAWREALLHSAKKDPAADEG